MANRVIRDWTASESMDLLSPHAEVFFTRLIMKADDYGSFHANPKLIKAALFPLKDHSFKLVETWLSECISSGLIARYEVSGKSYVRILNFGQRLQNMRNAFPAPDGDLIIIPVNHGESPLETKRNETEEETETKVVPLRAFVDENVNEAWGEWIQYLKEKKKKITPSTAKKQINFLEGRAGPEAIEIINKSITNGWVGLFDLTKQNHANGQYNKTTSTDFVPKQFGGANYKTKL